MKDEPPCRGLFSPLVEEDWNFDGVPDSELVACCYWEYARESAFIREVRQRCLVNQQTGGHFQMGLHLDLQKLQSIGSASEAFIRGFFFDPDRMHKNRHPDAPPITGKFPEPWQKLSEKERDYRAKIGNDAGRIPLAPIQRGGRGDLKDISYLMDSRRREEKSTFQDNPPSAIWSLGTEVTVVAIQWGWFTNDEIVNYFRKWAKTNRPAEIPAPSKQGRRLISARVKLERLAVMRLLHYFKLAGLSEACPAAWNRYHGPNRRWRKDVDKARSHFLDFFPFLPKGELPCSWPPRD